MKKLFIAFLSVAACFSALAIEDNRRPFVRAMLAECEAPNLDENMVEDRLNILVNFMQMPEGTSHLAGSFKAKEPMDACLAGEDGHAIEEDGLCYFSGAYRVAINSELSTGDIVFSDDWSYQVDDEVIPYFYDYAIPLSVQKQLSVDSTFALPRSLRTVENGELVVEYLYSYLCRVRGIITADDL